MLHPGPDRPSTSPRSVSAFVRGAAGLAWRAVRAALVFVVALFALYLIAGNALLLGRVPVRYFEGRTQSVRISYDSAWTWWPGAIWASDLVIAIQQRGEELEFRAEEASATIHIDDLVRGTVRMTNVDADDLSFRYRERRDDLAQAEAASVMLPPIPAFGALAVKDGTPKSVPPTDADYDKWRVVVDVTRASVREVWVESLRFQGPAAVSGGIDFKPYRWVKVPPTAVRIEGGSFQRVGLDEPDLLVDVDARARLAIPHFPVELDALDLLRFMDLDLAGDGMADAGAWLTALSVLPGPDALADDGTGPLRVRGALRQGQVVPGSRATWDTVHLDVVSAVGRATVVGPARVTAVAEADSVVHVSADTTATDLRLLALAGGLIHAEGAEGWIRMRNDPHLLDPVFAGGHVAVPAANMGLVGLKPAEEVRFEKGIAFARGVLDVDAGMRFSGKGATRVADLVMSASGMKVTGKLDADITLDEATFGDHVRVRAASFLRLDDMSLAAGEERVSGWWGRVEARSSMERIGDGPVSTQTSLHTRGRDAEPARAILEGAGYIPGIVGDQLEMKGLVATGLVESRGPRMQIDLEDATGEGARVRGRLVESGAEMRAAFLVETDVVDVGVAVARKKTSVQLLAGDGWLAEETAFLGGWQRASGAARGKSSGPIR